jgi:hypothetical protein
MPLSNITVSDGAINHVYNYIQQNGPRFYYRNTASSTLALPEFMEISHEAGTLTKADRHLVRQGFTDDSTDGTIVETSTIHTVVAAPRRIVDLATVRKQMIQMGNLLKDTAFQDAILAGSTP